MGGNRGIDTAISEPTMGRELMRANCMNTPGQTDGVLQAWLDGGLSVDRHDVAFRSSTYDFLVDAIDFSTFFGGNDATWAPTVYQTIDFDDFVICLPS